VLATLALLAASAEPLYRELEAPTPERIGLAAAVAGILSVVIGFWGLLYAGSKREWLHRRLMTERLRQLHFQSFVARFPHLVASLRSLEARRAFRAERDKRFERFHRDYAGSLPAELTAIIEKDRPEQVWLEGEPSDEPVQVHADDVDELLAAYRELRIVHQLRYANYKLRLDGPLRALPLRVQERLLTGFATACVLALFALHLWIATELASGHGLSTGPASHALLHVGTIWLAVLALSVRALEEGLGVRRENERYRDYRFAIEGIRARFDATRDVAKRIEIMADMERLAYEEMCSFLRVANDTRFVM
jgi:hypothetical protein